MRNQRSFFRVIRLALKIRAIVALQLHFAGFVNKGEHRQISVEVFSLPFSLNGFAPRVHA
jgi:hypothetical protein